MELTIVLPSLREDLLRETINESLSLHKESASEIATRCATAGGGGCDDPPKRGSVRSNGLLLSGLLSQSSETGDGGLGGQGGGGGELPRTTSNSLPTSSALPDSNDGSLHGVL